jgi:hypothetical protein
LFGITGCEKDTSGYGQHVLFIDNFSGTSYSLGVYIDDKFEGSIVARSRTSVHACCEQVKAGFREEHMFVTKYVSKGRHTVKLKNQANGQVMGSGDFTFNGDYITQDFSIN